MERVNILGNPVTRHDLLLRCAIGESSVSPRTHYVPLFNGDKLVRMRSDKELAAIALC